MAIRSRPRRERAAVIYTDESFESALRLAEQLRQSYDVTLTAQPKKLGKLLSRLEETGYTCYYNMSDPEPTIHPLGKKD